MKKIIDITHQGPLYDGSQHGHADFRGNLESAIELCKKRKPQTKIKILYSEIRYLQRRICRVDFERIVCVRFLKRKYKRLYNETYQENRG